MSVVRKHHDNDGHLTVFRRINAVKKPNSFLDSVAPLRSIAQLKANHSQMAARIKRKIPICREYRSQRRNAASPAKCTSRARLK